MSREPSKAYQTGKIYKIVNINDPEEFYIGSTKNLLRSRWQGHKQACEKNPHRKLYLLMNELGLDCFKIILLEDYPCDNRDQLRMREHHWITLLKPKLNQIKAYLSQEDKVLYKKEHKAVHKEQYAQWSKTSYEEHKEERIVYHKNYYEQHKDEILAVMKLPVECETCGKLISKGNMLRHLTNIHKNDETKYAVIEFASDDE
jgi:hypothetical protein